MDDQEQVFENERSDTNWYNGEHVKEMEMGHKRCEVVRCGVREGLRKRSRSPLKRKLPKEPRLRL
jgi:NOL1/NOP2/fmu family ribosome biogenesis protein